MGADDLLEIGGELLGDMANDLLEVAAELGADWDMDGDYVDDMDDGDEEYNYADDQVPQGEPSSNALYITPFYQLALVRYPLSVVCS